MTKNVFAVGLLLALMSEHVANAQSTTNIQTLLQNCDLDTQPYNSLFCAGKIGGIGDMMGINGLLVAKNSAALESFRKFSMCPGKPAPSYGAQIQVFKNWAQRHPERWAEQDFVGVIVALREAWPCG